MLMTAFQLNLG